jgi:signal peptidase I
VARAGRLGRTLLLYIVVGSAAGLLLAIALPLAFGARPLVVLSGSMEPTLATGDVVVVKRISPREAHTGDVVTYRNPQGSLVTHRVRSVRASGHRYELVTKGDANNASERWTMEADGELSRALYRVPLAGRLLERTSSPQGKLALIIAPLLLLGAWEIRRIWRPRESTA